jgi:hypothetical protein
VPLQEIDQHAQLERHLRAARCVQIKSGEKVGTRLIVRLIPETAFTVQQLHAAFNRDAARIRLLICISERTSNASTESADPSLTKIEGAIRTLNHAANGSYTYRFVCSAAKRID